MVKKTANRAETPMSPCKIDTTNDPRYLLAAVAKGDNNALIFPTALCPDRPLFCLHAATVNVIR